MTDEQKAEVMSFLESHEIGNSLAELSASTALTIIGELHTLKNNSSRAFEESKKALDTAMIAISTQRDRISELERELKMALKCVCSGCVDHRGGEE